MTVQTIIPLFPIVYSSNLEVFCYPFMDILTFLFFRFEIKSSNYFLYYRYFINGDIEHKSSQYQYPVSSTSIPTSKHRSEFEFVKQLPTSTGYWFYENEAVSGDIRSILRSPRSNSRRWILR